MSSKTTFTTSIPSLTIRDELIHSDSTSVNSNAGQFIITQVGGGDPYTLWGIEGTRFFAKGIDNSEGILKITTDTSECSPSTGTPIYSLTSNGQTTLPLQDAFQAYLAATDSDVTGTGAVYTLGTSPLTIVTDQNSSFTTGGVFTATEAGIYIFVCQIAFTGCTAATGFTVTVTPSVASGVIMLINRAASASDEYVRCSTPPIALSSSETVTFTCAAFGEAGDTVDILGGISPYRTFVGGAKIL